MSDLICIGKVLKPQGIYGELKIKDYSSGYNAIKDLKCVYIDQTEYKVLQIRYFSGCAFFMLKGISDRTNAENYRDKEIFAKKSEINVDENEFFIVDVLGCELCLSSGKVLGKIKDISDGRIDVYYVDTAEGVAVFPMLKKLEPKFDIENKRVTVNAKAFTEVVMYED